MPIPEFVVELRKHVGTAPLWLPAVTAIVVRDDEILLVKRSDNGLWSPVTGILDPGEEPAVAARREVMEETGVTISVDHLASISAGPLATHVNGDQARYLDHTFACTWVAGEPYPADDESTEARWFHHDELPTMKPVLLERIAVARSGESATQFRS